MLELTKAALQGTIPDENPFAGIDETDWNDVFEQSVVQGVMVLSLEGAMRLPKPLHPPHLLKLRWIAGVEAVEKRYLHQSETAKNLSSRFREHNIRMLLFKGLALSRLYPVPASREFGDLDIFLCGKAKEGDALLKQITSKNPVPSAKHVDYSYCGILIENHHYFLNRSFHRSDALEQRLMKILTEAGILGEADYRTDETLLFPPPDFDALFVTVHLLAHLPARIVLRFLCDLTVLFKAYKGKIDFHSYCDTLAESKLLKLANIFISLSVRYLGLSPEDAPPYESDFSLEDRIWNDMFYPEVSPHANGKRNFFNVIIHKIRLLRSRRWKNELVFPGQYGKKILYTIFYHLRHPKLIGKSR
jgi:hypothetical protein